MNNDSTHVKSLAHKKWNCKYHIVFAPKYRRKIFYEEHKLEVREILRKLCEWKGVEIIEGEVCPDHIHILVSLLCFSPPYPHNILCTKIRDFGMQISYFPISEI